MPEAYWISHVTVTDEEAYSRYAKLAVKAIEAHGGKFVARGGRAVQKEGPGYRRHVIARFPSLAEADSCYESALYQEALRHAEGASERQLVLVEAVS